ncbi:MAG: hypothetical protein LBT46_09535 [Planctomycetaceae bacterium]|jgi:hypothetical protein|nr:hypothetical protein [Planctomycetaceae bacterium]
MIFITEMILVSFLRPRRINILGGMIECKQMPGKSRNEMLSMMRNVVCS